MTAPDTVAKAAEALLSGAEERARDIEGHGHYNLVIARTLPFWYELNVKASPAGYTYTVCRGLTWAIVTHDQALVLIMADMATPSPDRLDAELDRVTAREEIRSKGL